jgi:hypothetical protein
MAKANKEAEAVAVVIGVGSAMLAVIVGLVSGMIGYSIGFDEGRAYPTDKTMRVYDFYDYEAVMQCVQDGFVEFEDGSFGSYDPELGPNCMTDNLNK